LIKRARCVFLQKRGAAKKLLPGYWDTAVGGHIDLGENVEMALRRETLEELGIDISEATVERLDTYVFTSERERELVYVHKTIYDGPVNPSANELDGGRFWTPDEIVNAMGNSIFTPNFEDEYKRFFGRIED